MDRVRKGPMPPIVAAARRPPHLALAQAFKIAEKS